MILLTLGSYHWHREQQAINRQLLKRERIFREHRSFDALTPLSDARYLREQLALCDAELQVHAPLAPHVPWPLHAFGQARSAQAGPAKPGSVQ